MTKEKVEIMRVKKPTELEYDYISRQEYFKRLDEGEEFSESFNMGWFESWLEFENLFGRR